MRDRVPRRDEDEPRYWYAAPYAWGYRPAITWEGWAFDMAILLACIAMGPYVRQDAHPFRSLGLFFGLLALGLAIRRWKGEPYSRD
jgi:hypothetical protein